MSRYLPVDQQNIEDSNTGRVSVIVEPGGIYNIHVFDSIEEAKDWIELENLSDFMYQIIEQ